MSDAAVAVHRCEACGIKMKNLKHRRCLKKDACRQRALRPIYCPVCLSASCALFVKLTRLKYTTEERRRMIVDLHFPVCAACKKRSPGKCARGERECKARDVIPRRLPDWWVKS